MASTIAQQCVTPFTARGGRTEQLAGGMAPHLQSHIRFFKRATVFSNHFYIIFVICLNVLACVVRIGSNYTFNIISDFFLCSDVILYFLFTVKYDTNI